MSEYKQVLVAVDLGDNSEKIVMRAADVAHSCDATLFILHVADYVPPFYGDYLIPPQDDTEEKIVDAATRQLKGLIERCALSGAQTLIVTGRPKIEIARIAEREKCDLIVVGAHGRHGIAGLLGSTANGVLQQANCDVLTVH